MNKAMQAVGSGVVIYIAKFYRGSRKLVAAHSEGDDARVAQSRSGSNNVTGRGGAKLAHCVHDPLQTKAARFVWGDGFAERVKVGFDILLAQEHPARRKRHFRVNDILSQHLLAH